MGALAAFIQDLIGPFLEFFYNIIIDILQYCIDCIPTFINSVIGFISYACPPPTMATEQASALSAGGSPLVDMLVIGLKTLAWVCPVAFALQFFQFITCGMMAYFTVVVAARWLKVLN